MNKGGGRVQCSIGTLRESPIMLFKIYLGQTLLKSIQFRKYLQNTIIRKVIDLRRKKTLMF